MDASFCLIDFETASACDLKKSGAYVYAEHPTTEILCLGYTDGAGYFVRQADELSFEYHKAKDTLLYRSVMDPKCFFIAHNVAFEKAIWRNLMMPLGWPNIPNDRWHDSQATCAMKALPLKLERVAMALRLSEQKDTTGTKVTLSFSKTGKNGMYVGAGRASALQRVYAYNEQDLRAELAVHRRVRGLGASERRVWLLDQTINERGVRLDMNFVHAAQVICDQASKPLLTRFHTLTGLKPSQRDKFMQWLLAKGSTLPDLKKETLDKVLGDEEDEADDTLADTDEDYEEPQAKIIIPEECREPLKLRRVLGSASIKKLAVMPLCCASDGRAHGLLQYHGAGPGRWSGRLLQPHNFPRPSLKIGKGFDKDGKELFEGHDAEQLVTAILTRDAEYVRSLFGEPIEAVASGLRHTLIAADGKTFEVGDFSTIEARIVLALAGARDALAIIMDKERDVYCEMAARIFGVKAPRGKAEIKYFKEAELAKRQTGKNTVLGCLAGDTLVLTQRGAIPILQVCTSDQLWDGVEWVAHDGLVNRGQQKTIQWLGLCLTPDHQVFDGEQWYPAGTAAQNGSIQFRALVAGSANLPWWAMNMATVAEYGSLSSVAHVGRRFIARLSAIFGSATARAVTFAQSNGLTTGVRNTLGTQTLCRMTNTGSDYSTEFPRLYSAVKTQKLGDTKTTGGEVSGSGLSGLKTGGRFSRTLSLFRAGISRSWNLTVKTTAAAMSRAIFGLLPGISTFTTDVQFKNFKLKSSGLRPVYDIANAGSRNRFTILTDAGPLLVHNCGFQMGAKKFRMRYAPKQPLSFAQSCVDAYRQDFAPEVPELWKALGEAATRTVWDRRGHEAYGIAYNMEDGFLTARLPSGRKLWYYDPQPVRKAMPWDATDIRPAFQYSAWKAGQWKRITGYGGLLTENAVQALARDLLCVGMFNAEADNHPVVLTVHDEIITEVNEWDADARLLDQYMTTVPLWAKQLGVPVSSECWVGGRYRK